MVCFKPGTYRVAVTFIDDNAVTDESDTSFGLIADVVTDNLGVDMVVLYWRHNDGSFTPVGMTPTSSQNEYEGSIPGPATLGDRFEYYIEAVDGGRRMRWPATAPDLNQTIVVFGGGPR